MNNYNKDLDGLKSNMDKANNGIKAGQNVQNGYEKDGFNGAIGVLDKDVNKDEDDEEEDEDEEEGEDE